MVFLCVARQEENGASTTTQDFKSKTTPAEFLKAVEPTDIEKIRFS